jgi:hypothetical protein
MVRAEFPALSRAVHQDGNELNSIANIKRTTPIQNLLFCASQRGFRGYARRRGVESPPPINSDFRDHLDCKIYFSVLVKGDLGDTPDEEGDCSRNVDSNSRSLIPMTRYVTRCSQQVGKN